MSRRKQKRQTQSSGAGMADDARKTLDILSFDQICKDMLEATLKGFAVAEIVCARDGNRIKPVKIKCHDERRFVFDRDWQPRLLTWAALTEGEALPPRKFIIHRVGVKGNNPYGLGLGSALFWPIATAICRRKSVGRRAD